MSPTSRRPKSKTKSSSTRCPAPSWSSLARPGGDRDHELWESRPMCGQQSITEMQSVIERVIVFKRPRSRLSLSEAWVDEEEIQIADIALCVKVNQTKTTDHLCGPKRLESRFERCEPMNERTMQSCDRGSSAIAGRTYWGPRSDHRDDRQRDEHRSPSSLRMTLSLAFLSPELVKAALEGRLPRGLIARRMTALPMHCVAFQWSGASESNPPPRPMVKRDRPASRSRSNGWLGCEQTPYGIAQSRKPNSARRDRRPRRRGKLPNVCRFPFA